jgi:hypothetical protein
MCLLAICSSSPCRSALYVGGPRAQPRGAVALDAALVLRLVGRSADRARLGIATPKPRVQTQTTQALGLRGFTSNRWHITKDMIHEESRSQGAPCHRGSDESSNAVLGSVRARRSESTRWHLDLCPAVRPAVGGDSVSGMGDASYGTLLP